MCKKLVVTLLLVFGTVAFLKSDKGRDLIRGWKDHSWGHKSRSVESEISNIQRDLKRLKNEDIEDIDKLAVKEQQIDKLRTEIKVIEKVASNRKEEILTLREELKAGNAFVKLSGKEFSSDRVKRHLTNVFNSYKRDVEELASLREKLQEQEASLQAAHDAVAAKRNQRRELEIRLIQLETKVHRLRRQDMEAKCSRVVIDDSKQSKILQRIQKVDDRIDLEVRKRRLKDQYYGELPTSTLQREVDNKDVLKEIDELFGTDKKVVDKQ